MESWRGLSEEKEAKIKKFAKEYIAKVLRKIEKSGRRSHGSASTRMSASTSTANNTPSTSMATPSSNDGGDSRTHGNAMSVEEVMGMELHSDDEHTDEDEDEDDEGDGDKMQVLPPTSPPRGRHEYDASAQGPATGSRVTRRGRRHDGHRRCAFLPRRIHADDTQWTSIDTGEIFFCTPLQLLI